MTTSRATPPGPASIEANGAGRAQPGTRRDDGYKWIALSNTTIGILMATINSSILLIALPDIFRGIGIEPLAPGNTSYFLWILMGFMLVTAVLVVSLGRIGDMYGRVRMYNLGFAIFTVFSILLAVTWMHGDAGAWWLIIMRLGQGVGGSFLFANSTAILTDAFPENQRGVALGASGVALISGSFIGLVLGGVLAPIEWHLVFLVSVPFGLFGTVWAYLKLRDNGIRTPARIDWAGNVTFAIGLTAVLVGIVYGLQPYGGHTMGWTNPFVLTCMFGGLAVLIGFGVIETRVADPMFRLDLFRNRVFFMGSLTAMLGSLARGGLQFMLIIWLQGIWLPEHGYSFSQTPLWAGIYMVPLTIGFLLSGPLAGLLADLFGARPFATAGMGATALAFVALNFVPIDFAYWQFAIVLFLLGLAMGVFSAPNSSSVMNSLPASQRGVGAGMMNTFQNSAGVLSIGVFFTVIALGLASRLPSTMYSGLVAQGVPADTAHQVAGLPPIGSLFAAFLGFNPTEQLLGHHTLSQLTPAQSKYLTGQSFFPHLISGPFADGLHLAFWFAAAVCALATVLSWLRGAGGARGTRTLLDETGEGLAGAGEIAALEIGAGTGDTTELEEIAQDSAAVAD